MIGQLGGWARTAAATWLLFVGSLAAWSLAPVLVGWRPVVIVTGSMQPNVHPGDVVLVDPGVARVQPGQVALLRDPEMPTGSKVHRVLRIADDGTMTTKGDANPTPDTRPAAPSDVVGVARLLVPGAGRLALLRSAGRPADLWWVGATAGAALVLVLIPRPPTR